MLQVIDAKPDRRNSKRAEWKTLGEVQHVVLYCKKTFDKIPQRLLN